jgi:succinyl-diaminopimelate desuccinylase
MNPIIENFNKELENIDVSKICQDIVRINSINPPGDELNLARYCGDFLRGIGFEVSLLKHSENRASVLACLKGSGQVPGVMVCSHMDTVPVGEVPWQHDPLGGEVFDGKIWGRGTSDMKGGLAASLAAVKVLVGSGFKPQGNLWIGLTAGEEVNFLGAIEIAKHREVLPLQVLLIPEPSSNDIYLAQKGALWLEVVMQGKTAHGSMPEMGINAVESMVQFIHQYKSLKIPYQSHPLLDGFTSAVTTIKGGVKTNVVPDACSITIDMRTMPGQNHSEILNQIKSLLNDLENEVPGLTTRVNILNNRPAVVTEMDNPKVQIIRAAAGSILDRSVPIKGVKFFTDSAILTPAWDVPMIICGPGHAELAHQPNEYIEIEMLRESVKIYVLALARYLG